MQIIDKYFLELSTVQRKKLSQLEPIYQEINSRINLISRKDIVHFYERHVLHGLFIAKIIQFSSGSRVLDLGSGGGFPGIPLAIFFPDVEFVLADSIEKKTNATEQVIKELNLQNAIAVNTRVERMKSKFDFVVCRAVAKTNKLISWIEPLISDSNKNELSNGLLALKGGALIEEIKSVKKEVHIYNISEYFDEPFFETKKLLYVKW